MVKILLLIGCSIECLYYETLLGEIGIFEWAKEWKADAIITQRNKGQFEILKTLNIPVF